MGVITVSRQYGSAGRTVGHIAAEALGYRYIDKELVVAVAHEAEVPVSEVECFDEQPEHPIARALKKFLTPPGAVTGLAGEEWVGPMALPVLLNQEESEVAILDEDAYVKLTDKIMARLADEGDVVLVGRGSQILLADRPDVLHVRIVAPEEFRIRIVMEEDGLDRAEAVKRIQKRDEQRRRYIKRHYDADWDAPEHYHLVINTGQMAVEVAARVLAEAARNLPMAQQAALEA